MTLRKIAGLGALLSPQTPGTHLALATTLESGGTPRRHRAHGPLLFVAIPCLASALCVSTRLLTFADTAAAGGRKRLHGFALGDALISLIRPGIPIRGST